MQREATISTYSDGAKLMAKVRTEILNRIDSMSSFRQPFDLGKDDTNLRKRAKDQIDTKDIKKSPSTSTTGNDKLQDKIPDINENMRSNVEIDSKNVIINAEQTTNKESESLIKETTTEKVEKIDNHDWLANGYNISKNFCDFQVSMVEQLKNNLTLSYATDVDKILCLLSISYVKENKLKYVKCSDQVWKTRLPKSLIPATLPISAQLNIMEYTFK
ncbi:hypothetical protein G9A89_003045 [Geosiphon pyriformis]|nr:hypothetical protein G9A89_003045 [Geosiphon pyriformis]